MAQDSASLLSIKRKKLLTLDTQKKALEREADAIVSELTTAPPNGGEPIGIDTPLVDSEGYPRADIDVHRARTLRKRFREIQTDHKQFMKKIDLFLVEVSALTKSEQSTPQKPNSSTTNDNDEIQARLAPKPLPKFDHRTGKWVVNSWDGSVVGVENGELRSFENLSAPHPSVSLASSAGRGDGTASNNAQNSSSSGRNITQQQQQQQQQSLQEEPTIPFAIIDEVFPNSPAHEAGLMVGDLLLRFGSATSENHRDLRAIAELVPEAAGGGRHISIAVRRKEKRGGAEAGTARVVIKKVDLRPKPWSGRGLLGCHIQKYGEGR